MTKNEFVIKEYLEKVKQELENKDEDTLFLELKRLRSNLILEDLKKFFIIEKIENLPYKVNATFTDEEVKELEDIANKLNMDLDDTKAIIYIEMLLDTKKEEASKKYPEAMIVDIYELVLTSPYLYKLDKELKVITIFDLEKELEIKFI